MKRGFKLRKRMFVLGVLSIILIGFFIAVSLNPNEEVVENEERETVELIFWRNAGNAPINKAFEEIVKEFESENPYIKINTIEMDGSQDYELRLRAELASGNHPDIMTIDSPNLALYANAGELLSLDEYMKEEGNIDDILEGSLNGMVFREEIYLAPFVDSSIALYYNKNLFRQAGIPFPSKDPEEPLTWDEVLTIAQTINDPDNGIHGIDIAQGFGSGEGPAYFKLPLLWQFGADVISPDGTTAKGHLNSEAALEALQFYQDLYQKHQVSTLILPDLALETDKLAMTVLGSWHLAQLESVPGFDFEEDFGIAPLPKGDYQVTPNGGWAMGISSRTDYPDEAWEFVKFLTSNEGSRIYFEHTGDIPARYSVAEQIPELNEYPYNIFVQQGQKYSRNRPVTPAYATVSETIKILFEEVGIAGRDVKEAADDAVLKIDKVLKTHENTGNDKN